jgi:outer membrane cobalamin receptor
MLTLPHRARRRALLVTAVIAQSLVTANDANAQVPIEEQSREDVQEVIVTGSRIVRQELTATSPIAVINEDTIRLNNPITIEEVLRRSPQFAPAIGGQVNNGNPGAATLDLRNLGEERTLVLVDGKRFVPYDSQNIVDVNIIPASLLQRVEVITGSRTRSPRPTGASAGSRRTTCCSPTAASAPTRRRRSTRPSPATTTSGVPSSTPAARSRPA